MVEHIGVRPLLLGCALCSLSLLAIAESPPPEQEPALPSRFFYQVPGPDAEPSTDSSKAEESDKSTENSVNSFGVVSPEQANQFYQQLQQRQAKLREQLADSKQRDQLLAERIEQLRTDKPDLALLLRLDARTEDKLLTLLANQQLSEELRPPADIMGARASGSSNGKPYNPLRDEAARYTKRMNEISKVLDAAQLDDYADYERKLGIRARVVAFDAFLPAADKLTLEQRNALTDLFYDQIGRQVYTTNPFRGFERLLLEPNVTDAERDRRMQVLNIASNERRATLEEVANRKLVERARPILTPEQTKSLADWKQQDLNRQRDWSQAQRKTLGIAPDQKLDDWSDDILTSPPLSRSMRLTIYLTVNDKQVVKQLTSVRGDRVAFDAPEGLLAEVRPYMVEQQLWAEIMLYEKVPDGRRRIGQVINGVQLIEAGKPAVYGGSASCLIEGRKGYAIDLTVRGTYL